MKNGTLIQFSPLDGLEAAPAVGGSAGADRVVAGADGAGDGTAGTVVRLDGERIVVERLVLVDAGLAGFVAERPADDRPALVERALRIGLVALQDAGVTVNVDAVRREFDGLLSRTAQANERAAAALDELLRQNFADGDGRLPRTLEAFLGDRGRLQAFVTDLFDESKRDSAIGKMRELLGTYFDGDASRLALLLDPTRMNSPLHQFRAEVADGFTRLHERLAAIEAAAAARASERARSAAKGADFEDLLEAMLGDVARGSGDLVDRTGNEAGDVIRSKKGDFVLTRRPGPDRRRRAADRRRGEGPGDVGPPDARRDPRGEDEPRRRRRAGRVHAGPRPERDRPVRHPRRGRLLRRRSGGAGPGHLRGGRPAGPPAGPS